MGSGCDGAMHRCLTARAGGIYNSPTFKLVPRGQKGRRALHARIEIRQGPGNGTFFYAPEVAPAWP